MKTSPGQAAVRRPVALLHGPGHLIVHGNPPFLAQFGQGCLGLPAAEVLVGLPRVAFEAMDVAYGEGRAVSCRLLVYERHLRMTVVPKRDAATGEVYGVAIRLAPDVERAG